MAPRAAPSGKLPLAPVVAGAVGIAALLGLLFYLNRPAAKPVEEPASADAKAYVSNLALSDVTMKASENFMKQQVVEIEGKIANNGPRSLESVDVYCYFSDVNGRQIYRERVPIVKSRGVPLRPQEVRSFRLPFDSLPDGWNQAMPKLVIAQITFTQ